MIDYEAQGYRFYGGHTYKLIKILTTQNTARKLCQELGGHLAIIDNREQFDYLCNWVGNTRTWVEGSEKAVNSSDLSHINLNNGKYADYSAYPWSGDGGYTALFIYNSGYFADENPETMPYQYICEWDYDLHDIDTETLESNGCKFHDGHTFKYFSTPLTWAMAKVFCEELGGHLATSTSSEKNTFLTTLTTATAWLGGTDEETEGTWKWVTGEAWSYTNWNSGQPDNNNGLGEHYLQVNWEGTGKWNDISAATSCGFICEWDYDMREELSSSHEELSHLMGGTTNEHYHLTENEINKLQAVLGVLFPNGAAEPVFPSTSVILSESDFRVFPTVTDNTAYYEKQGYHFFGGHTFRYYTAKLTWANAKTACEVVGGHLATSTNAEKNAFLASLTSATIWLGATDEVTEGTWKWVNGEKWSYSNWGSTQPDNASGVEHYLEINRGGAGLWNDLSGTAAQPFICEWDYDIRILPARDTLNFLTNNGYKFFNGRTFKYVNTANTWENANAICEAVGGHLATSTSAEKNAFIRGLSSVTLWLGGSDKETEGVWKWVNGEKWDYSNWGLGEPNNSTGEPYLELYANGKWNDIVPTTTHAYVCEWDFDILSRMIRNHEGDNNLLGGSVSGHYHFTEDELGKLQKILDLLFPDGATEPVLPSVPVTPSEDDKPSGSEGELFAGLPSLTPPQWTSVRLPNYSAKVQYSCYNAVHSMYYGTSAAKKKTTPKTGLHVLLEYGNNTNCYLAFTQDLNTWNKEKTFNKKNEAGRGISQYMYINTGNTSSAYQHRLYVMLPGRTSKTNMIRFLYGENSSTGSSSEHYISQSNVGSKTAYVACCYSDKLKMYIFVSEAGNVARADASSSKNHKVLAKEKDNNCGITVNPGCAAWSKYANVFCVTGSQGTATSVDGKGAWTVHKNAPKNLVDLVYREDIPGSQPKGFFARSVSDKCFYASVDGANWLKVNTAPIPLSEVAAVAYAPELGWYCAIGGKSKYAFFSKDLTKWISSTVDNSQIDMGSVIWMPNVRKFVLMPKSGTFFYTFAPADWSE